MFRLHFTSTCCLSAFLQACRALAVCAVITGFFGSVLTLIGMKCTKIGGTEIINARVTFSGALTYLASGKNPLIQCCLIHWKNIQEMLHTDSFLLGVCGIITYSWWANRIITEFKDPNFKAQKWVLFKWHYCNSKWVLIFLKNAWKTNNTSAFTSDLNLELRFLLAGEDQSS